MEEKAFLLVSYLGKISDTNTTFEEAKNKLIILNTGQMIPKLEKALGTLNEGEEVEVSVSPREGFGERDPSLIRIVPQSTFIKENITPTPGKAVSINGLFAKIRSVNSGRVMADFNHPLAGEHLTYHLKLEKILTTDKEKIEALAKDIGIDADVKEEEQKVVIKVKNPPSQNVYSQKKEVLKSVIKSFFNNINEIEFHE
ncbi:MAG: FKBP-type peptidyl-prolyl cis-trans isomerase [Candidatus Anstonellales archaeon]